jgi:hypothetical protein
MGTAGHTANDPSHADLAAAPVQRLPGLRRILASRIGLPPPRPKPKPATGTRP